VDFVELNECFVGWEERGVQDGGDAGEAFEQGGSWGIKELVGNAKDAAVAYGAEMVPVALVYDAL